MRTSSVFFCACWWLWVGGGAAFDHQTKSFPKEVNSQEVDTLLIDDKKHRRTIADASACSLTSVPSDTFSGAKETTFCPDLCGPGRNFTITTEFSIINLQNCELHCEEDQLFGDDFFD